jgi:AGZA family xanthine/uracil permease-like MFS transporter
MGLLANYPFALAPGMGLNAFFTYGVVIGKGVSYQVALAAVFVEGLLFLGLSAGGVRTAIVNAIPITLKVATMSGIGLFLAIIGMRSAGLVVDSEATLVTLGDLSRTEVLLALLGLLLIAALHARQIKGAILIGIVAVTVAAWSLGAAAWPSRLVTAPAFPQETLLALDFTPLLTGKLLVVILAFLFVDFFDTAGTLIGVGRLGGFLDHRGELPRANRAFMADAIGTSVGALLGTSTVTSYIESATGIEDGGRTGLTAVTVAVLFLLSLFFTPLFVAVPACATAPALIVIGALMMHGVGEIPWRKMEHALPAFLTIVAMPFTYSIANGIALGIVAWTLLRLLCGRAREVHWLLWLLTVLLITYYGFVEPT